MAVTRTKSDATYQTATFAVPSPMVDDAAALLIAWGALGCAVERVSRAGRPRGPVANLQAWFKRIAPAELARIHHKLRDLRMIAGDVPQLSNLTDPGWATMWMDRFKPLPIGLRLTILPPWETATTASTVHDDGRVGLIIRPGQGFGTGHHPTTAGALVALEDICKRTPPRDALDVGTGSGVLAIAMRLYGVKRVVAIDNDPAALENARENAALNQISGLRFSLARVETFRRRLDLVTANILSSTLIRMAPTLCRLVNRDGRLILGGILARERSAVLKHYGPPMRLIRSRIDRGWATLVLGR